MNPTSRAVGPRQPPTPRRLRRHGRRWPWMVLLAALIPVAAWAVPRLTDEEPETVLALPTTTTPATTLVGFGTPVGERSSGPTCWMVVVDESSSMATADQAGIRADAVRAAAEFLAAHGVDGDRIGATWFADQAEVLAPAEPTTAATAATGRVDLGSGTRISTALAATLDAMAGACGTATKVLVLVSDGAASGPDDFAATQSALAAAPGVHAHLIAMNGSGAFEPSRGFWQDPALGLDSVVTIDSFGGDEVAAAVADVLSIETGQQVTPT